MKINQNYLPPQNFAVISTLLLKLHTRNVRVKEHFCHPLKGGSKLDSLEWLEIQRIMQHSDCFII